MNARELRRALEAAAGEDQGARERSRRVVRAAFARYEPLPRRRRWTAVVLAVVLLAVGSVGAAAASAPDSGVGRWVRDVLGVGEGGAAPGLLRVPGGGRLLVEAGDGVWVVAPDGARRRLGTYAGGSWSPHGLYVAVWRDRTLTAADPEGRVRWSISRRGRISAVQWGPADGYRIAYLSGSMLRIVNGDGTGDRRYAAARTGVAPAWRPDAGHVLAYVDPAGRIDVVAVDARRRLWRTARLPAVRKLAWSSSGRRLLALTPRRVVLFDRAGRRVGSRAVAAAYRLQDAAWSPGGAEVALVRWEPAAGRSQVLLADASRGLREEVLFTGAGRFGTPAWSPTGTRLLLPWPAADQWLFLRPRGAGRVAAVGSVAAQFAPGAPSAEFPRSVAWCCASATP
jgi:hypothetical protein